MRRQLVPSPRDAETVSATTTPGRVPLAQLDLDRPAGRGGAARLDPDARAVARARGEGADARGLLQDVARSGAGARHLHHVRPSGAPACATRASVAEYPLHPAVPASNDPLMPAPSAAAMRIPSRTRRTASTATASPRRARRWVTTTSRRPPFAHGRAVTARRRKARPRATGGEAQRRTTRPFSARWTTARMAGAPTEPAASARTRPRRGRSAPARCRRTAPGDERHGPGAGGAREARDPAPLGASAARTRVSRPPAGPIPPYRSRTRHRAPGRPVGSSAAMAGAQAAPRPRTSTRPARRARRTCRRGWRHGGFLPVRRPGPVSGSRLVRLCGHDANPSVVSFIVPTRPPLEGACGKL